MTGLGTVINIAAVLAGGMAGIVLKRGIGERMRETMIAAIGTCVMFIGISGALKEMIVVVGDGVVMNGTMMLICCFVVGTVVGEALDIDGGIARFGEWLKRRSGNQEDDRFMNAFLTASITICVGAMAIVGSVQDALRNDYSILFAKSALDGIFIMIMTASFGKGAIYSAIPVGVFQGCVTLLAGVIEPILTESALSSISLTGSLMIFLVGVNQVFDRRIRIANMLPALVVAVVWALCF